MSQNTRHAANYRLRLAEGFLNEARQDITLQRWRSCVDNSQLAVENAAKVGLALLEPVGRTHNPAALLRRAMVERRVPLAAFPQIAQLAECAELLGPDLHAASDYGDETVGRTPWEMFARRTPMTLWLLPNAQWMLHARSWEKIYAMRRDD